MYRYQNIAVTKQAPALPQYFVNNIYPDIPLSNDDNYVITTLGDRLDLLANDFYGDVDLWWIIASANSLTGDSLFPPIGMQLRIPVNVQDIINSYKSVNIVR
jgi:hypothetical protein